MDIVKLLNYMENLRYDRKMSQEIYLQDVISQRQYYRYRGGESEVPFEVIVKFANKLEIPLLKLISLFQTHSEKEKEIVRNYCYLIIDRRLNEASKFISKYGRMLLLDDETKKYYYLATVLNEYFLDKISISEMIDKLKLKIEFENIMKKEVLHDSELYLLGVIMQYSDDDRELIYRKIINLRKKGKLLLGNNVLYNSQLYFWITKSLGRLNKYKELIDIADEAIEYSKRNFSYYSLEHFYYFKALAYYKRNMKKDFEESLTQTIYVLLQRDQHKRDRFFEMISKDTDIDCKEFLISRIKEEFQ